jgi:hypothetical protein
MSTDGAPSVVGSLNGFVPRAKKENENIMSTHWFLHREISGFKNSRSGIKFVLNEEQITLEVNCSKHCNLQSTVKRWDLNM